MSMGYERGKLDGLRFAEFRVYEHIAILRIGGAVYVPGQISRPYCEGLRDAGCQLR